MISVILIKNMLLFLIEHFFQLKDAATTDLAREKVTSLAELFSVELKLTIHLIIGFQIELNQNF